MQSLEICEKVEKIAVPICKRLGVDLWDIEFKKEGASYYLRIFIDKENGIAINDCENFSKAIDAPLDEEDFIDKAYILEVSSPGIERVLSKDWHFKKYVESKVEVKLFSPINGQKKLCGILDAYDEGKITIIVDDKKIIIRKNEAAYVRLNVVF